MSFAKLPPLGTQKRIETRFFGISLSLALLIACATSTLLSACSSIPLSKPQAPTVSVTAVKPLNFDLTSQELVFTLLVKNPNSFDLPMESMTFNANFAGEHLAQGSSVKRVTIPAKGDATLDVTVTAGISNLFNQLGAVLNQQSNALDYDVKGVVKLANWPAAIPFNVEGELADPIKQLQAQ